mgnify:CR=1 FL=1
MTNPFKKDNEEAVEETTVENAEEEKQEETSEDNKLQEEYDALNQQYIRLAADFDNYRKRQEQERENLLKFGTENALTKLLEILDNFERGAKALENVEDCQTVKDSFNLVHKQVIETLQKLGLEEIENSLNEEIQLEELIIPEKNQVDINTNPFANINTTNLYLWENMP